MMLGNRAHRNEAMKLANLPYGTMTIFGIEVYEYQLQTDDTH